MSKTIILVSIAICFCLFSMTSSSVHAKSKGSNDFWNFRLQNMMFCMNPTQWSTFPDNITQIFILTNDTSLFSYLNFNCNPIGNSNCAEGSNLSVCNWEFDYPAFEMDCWKTYIAGFQIITHNSKKNSEWVFAAGKIQKYKEKVKP